MSYSVDIVLYYILYLLFTFLSMCRTVRIGVRYNSRGNCISYSVYSHYLPREVCTEEKVNRIQHAYMHHNGIIGKRSIATIQEIIILMVLKQVMYSTVVW